MTRAHVSGGVIAVVNGGRGPPGPMTDAVTLREVVAPISFPSTGTAYLWLDQSRHYARLMYDDGSVIDFIPDRS